MAKSISKSRSQSTVGGSKEATFVQADSACFREVVQRLTGPSESDVSRKTASPNTSKPQKQPSKLHERRQWQRPNIEITKPTSQLIQSIIIPSPYEWQCLVPISGTQCSPNLSLSPFSLQPLSPQLSSPITRPKKRGSPSIEMNKVEEEKAIKERRFYLHPSPRSKYENSVEPELLTLFPLTSPRGNNES